jgi:hypothetical protein
MSLDKLVPGRYPAKVKSWGMKEIESTGPMGGQLKVIVQFELVPKGAITWEGLLLTKDGQRNKKTFTILSTLGFEDHDDMTKFFAENALPKDKEFELTVIDAVVKDKIYKRVDWVNTPGGAGLTPKPAELNSIKDKLVSLGMAKAGPSLPPNLAPQATASALPDLPDVPF